MQEDAVLILSDWGRHCEEREHQRGGLGSGQGGGGQRVGAEGMMQDRGGTCQEEPHGIRQKGRGGGAVTVEITLHRFAIVFTVPPGAGEVYIDLLGYRRLQGGHDKPRIVPRGHDFGFDDDPPRLGP